VREVQALTAWGADDEKTHNAEVKEAALYLVGHVIPDFAQKLDHDWGQLDQAPKEKGI